MESTTKIYELGVLAELNPEVAKLKNDGVFVRFVASPEGKLLGVVHGAKPKKSKEEWLAKINNTLESLYMDKKKLEDGIMKFSQKKLAEVQNGDISKFNEDKRELIKLEERISNWTKRKNALS